MSVKLYSHKKLFFMLLIGSFLVFPQAVMACQIVSANAPTAPRIEYDVYGFDRAIASTELDLTNTGDAECVLDIVVEDLASFPPPFHFAAAGVGIDVTAPGLQRPQTAQNINGIFELILPAGASERVQLDFYTDQIVSVPAGLYDRDIKISVRPSSTTEILVNEITNLSLISSSQAQVNIAGAAGTFNKNAYMDAIDFGEPEIGMSRRVFVQSRSNAMATMTIRSDNGGVMKHSVVDGSSIGYVAALDNQTLDLTTAHVIPNLSTTDLNGKSQSLDLTIDSLNTPYAGQYSDRIIIEIEAR